MVTENIEASRAPLSKSIQNVVPELSTYSGDVKHSPMKGDPTKRVPEPLLTEQRNRFVLFPIQNDAVWEMYKKHVASFWTAEEIDLGDDMKHWYNAPLLSHLHSF